jgi:hypothetical protein
MEKDFTESLKKVHPDIRNIKVKLELIPPPEMQAQMSQLLSQLADRTGTNFDHSGETYKTCVSSRNSPARALRTGRSCEASWRNSKSLWRDTSSRDEITSAQSSR